MLGMAFFKSLVKEHGRAYFEPIGKALQRHQIKTFNPLNPTHLWKLRGELSAYAKWSLSRKLLARDWQPIAGLNPSWRNTCSSRKTCAKNTRSRSARHEQASAQIGDRQCRMAELSSACRTRS